MPKKSVGMSSLIHATTEESHWTFFTQWRFIFVLFCFFVFSMQLFLYLKLIDYLPVNMWFSRILSYLSNTSGSLLPMIIWVWFSNIQFFTFNDISFAMYELCAWKNTTALRITQSRTLFCLILFCLYLVCAKYFGSYTESEEEQTFLINGLKPGFIKIKRSFAMDSLELTELST